MTIYLIRHGKTEANEKRLYCGSTDLPLSVAGRQELQNIRYDIKNVRFITSGMKRTEETMHILFGDVPYEIDSRFREVDFGIFEMRSYKQLKEIPAKTEEQEREKLRKIEEAYPKGQRYIPYKTPDNVI